MDHPKSLNQLLPVLVPALVMTALFLGWQGDAMKNAIMIVGGVQG